MQCPACGHQTPDGAKFCSECGAKFAARAAPERSPRDYTPHHLAERILTARAALEGERKRVTVLFVDVRGSSELSERLDPEEWHRILDRFFEILTEGVHRFEGTVNQYTGDGIMALFGAPIAHEDHAQRACYAALWLRDRLREYTQELRRDWIERHEQLGSLPELCVLEAELARVLGEAAAHERHLRAARDAAREIGANSRAERLDAELSRIGSEGP